MSRHRLSVSLHHRGFLLGLFALTLIRGILYSVVVPPWQAPDEPGHVEYAALLAEKRWLLRREDVSPDLQRQILSSMKEFDFWRHLGRDEPQEIPQSFSQDPSLALSGTQLGDESPLYYLIPALVLVVAGVRDPLLQLYILRWFSAFLSSATVVVCYLAAAELFPEDRFMRIAVAAFAFFLPMFAYMGSAANSDVMAILCSSLVLWQLIVVFKKGASWRSVSALIALVGLAIIAKKTASFTAPLLLIAVPVYLWGRRTRISQPLRQAATGALVISALLLGVFSVWATGDAAHWVKRPPSSVNARSEETARSGLYSLRVANRQGDVCQRLVQTLPHNSVRDLRGRTTELRAWVRSTEARQGSHLAIADSEGESTRIFTATDKWELHSVTRAISPQATSIRVILGSSECTGTGSGELFFDDVFLGDRRGGGLNLLTNSSAETPALRVLERLDRVAPHLSLSPLLDGRSCDGDSVKKCAFYTLLTFAGFWGNFGWLTLPLHPAWYALLALLSLALVAGLGLWLSDRLRLLRGSTNPVPTWQDRALFLLLVGLCLILLQTFLPMIGRDWQPQGRYLFPAIFPIATLLSLGWRRLHARWGSNVALTAWVMLLFLLHVLCIFGYVIPHYHR